LFRPLLKSPSLITAEQYAYCSGGKINFWSHLGEERPEKHQKIHRTPSRGRIESIKSAGKRSQKVTLITCSRHFLETLISCRIYTPKNAVLQVNPLGTSLEVLLILTFCCLCRLLDTHQRSEFQHKKRDTDTSRYHDHPPLLKVLTV